MQFNWLPNPEPNPEGVGRQLPFGQLVGVGRPMPSAKKRGASGFVPTSRLRARCPAACVDIFSGNLGKIGVTGGFLFIYLLF